MKTKAIFTIFLLIMLGLPVFASAEDSVSDTLESLSENSYKDILIIYGDDASIEDMLGAFMISNIFPIIDKNLGREPYLKKASEVASFQNKNLILVGGPCANIISEKITDEVGYNCNDWKFDDGKAVVKVFGNGEGKVVMVAGTTKMDTWKMSDAMRRYDKSEKLKSSDEVIFDTPLEGECGNGICETGETDENCPADCSNEGSVQLTSDMIVSTPLDISGDYVVFSALDGAAFYATSSSVYFQNLKTKELKRIGEGTDPKIDGDYIVYVGQDEVLNEKMGNYVKWPSIKLYQISADETISLTEAKIWYYFNEPMISGNRVVWLERNEFYNDISLPKLMMYDIETGLTEKLTDVRNYDDVNFKIYGDKIVYQGPKYCVPEDCAQSKTYEPAKEGDSDIWLYDISTDEKKRLTSDKEYQGMPEIWGNFIVWVDDRSVAEGNKGVYLYNILTGEEKPLNLTYIVPAGGHTALSFSDYNVIWTDYRNSNGASNNEDVYFYNIQENTERRVTLNSYHQGGGVLEGNYVVWVDHRNRSLDTDTSDLYMMELA